LYGNIKNILGGHKQNTKHLHPYKDADNCMFGVYADNCMFGVYADNCMFGVYADNCMFGVYADNCMFGVSEMLC